MTKDYIVLFDLDGTLIDSTQAIYASFCAAFRAINGSAPSFESMRQTIGHTLEDMFLSQGVRGDEVKQYVEQYRVAYRALMEQGTQLLPHAREAIERASEFATLGVVTTKRGDFSQILLEKLGVWGYFSGIVGIESVKYPKPHAEPILKALDMLECGQDRSRIYMIGDTLLDIQAAKNAHIQAIGVLCGFGKMEQMQDTQVPLYANALEAVRAIADSRM